MAVPHVGAVTSGNWSETISNHIHFSHASDNSKTKKCHPSSWSHIVVYYARYMLNSLSIDFKKVLVFLELE